MGTVATDTSAARAATESQLEPRPAPPTVRNTSTEGKSVNRSRYCFLEPMRVLLDERWRHPILPAAHSQV
jgi:hypothetical protein